jgi:hypothetical protein
MVVQLVDRFLGKEVRVGSSPTHGSIMAVALGCGQVS